MLTYFEGKEDDKDDGTNSTLQVVDGAMIPCGRPFAAALVDCTNLLFPRIDPAKPRGFFTATTFTADLPFSDLRTKAIRVLIKGSMANATNAQTLFRVCARENR